MSIPREKLEEIFKKADENGDGLVSASEILKAGGKSIIDSDVHTDLLESLLSGGDLDKDKKLSLDEFLKYTEQKQA
jgi:Ca2+-binding EF-hand superfamily protein